MLFIIVVVGFLLRIYKLGAQSLWLDEAITASIAQQPMTAILFNNLDGLHPPLYHAFMHVWVVLFGTSEFSLRFPSVLFGTIAIIIIYVVAKRVLNVPIARLSALLMAILPFQIAYSQEARMYTLFLMLSLLSVYFLIRALETKQSYSWILYALSTALLFYTHYYAIFTLGFIALFLLLQFKHHRYQWKKWLAWHGVLFLLILPLLLISRSLDNLGFIQAPGAQELSVLFTSIGIIPTAALFRIGIADITLNIGLVITLFLSSVGIVHLTKKYPRSTLALCLLWFLVPLAGAVAFSHLFFPIFVNRYLITISSPLYLLMAAGVHSFAKKYVRVLLLVLLLGLGLLGTWQYYHEQKDQWNALAQYLENKSTSHDIIVLVPAETVIPFDYYFTQNMTRIPVSNATALDKELNKIKMKDEFWFVLNNAIAPHLFGAYEEIISYLDTRYQREQIKEFVGILLWKYGPNK